MLSFFFHLLLFVYDPVQFLLRPGLEGFRVQGLYGGSDRGYRG